MKLGRCQSRTVLHLLGFCGYTLEFDRVRRDRTLAGPWQEGVPPAAQGLTSIKAQTMDNGGGGVGKVIIIIVLVIGGLIVCSGCLGVVAAIAIPAFTKYVEQSKAAGESSMLEPPMAREALPYVVSEGW